MNTDCRHLVIGLGSSHGDDQAGWKVIERLESYELPKVQRRLAAVPSDLFDWLGDVDSLHIIDGCTWNIAHDTPLRLDVVASDRGDESNLQLMGPANSMSGKCALERPLALRSSSSHQIDVLTALELAASLNLLPKRVALWAVPGRAFGPGTEISMPCLESIAQCAEQLSRELRRA